MIKLVIFDLDGVLVVSKDMHYECLNRALKEVDSKYVISKEDHFKTFDGLSTRQKLNILTEKMGLSVEHHQQIYERKQKLTVEYLINDVKPEENDLRIQEIMKELKRRNILIYIASNAIYNTVKLFLSQKGFIKYVDYFITNEDVKFPKPHPEIYLRCLIRSGCKPRECLIIEDSPIGRQAAIDSGCQLLPVNNPSEVMLSKIESYLNQNMSEKKLGWQGKINVVIPMAGAGSRFAKVGYTFPKPLIDVRGKAMIQTVVDNLALGPAAKFHFIVQKEHYEKYNLQHFLNAIAPGCEIIITEGMTEGAACSVLLAKEFVNDDTPLLLANSDQFVIWDSNEFLYKMTSRGVDGGILTFESHHPKWSYAKIDDSGLVTEVAEKNPISSHATVGIYYWKHGSDFVSCAEEMIEKNIRINNEFYVCPVYNRAIDRGMKIMTSDCEEMWGIGTPEDLQNFLTNYSYKI